MCGGAFMILKFENIYVDQLLIHALHKAECILQKDLSSFIHIEFGMF